MFVVVFLLGPRNYDRQHNSGLIRDPEKVYVDQLPSLPSQPPDAASESGLAMFPGSG
jgi:hypothetical protein